MPDSPRQFRLSRDGYRAYVNAQGAFTGPEIPLLEKDSRGQWRPRPQADLERLFAVAFGTPVGLGWRMDKLASVARALNAGDLSFAAIALVQAEFPPLPDDKASARMAKVDALLRAYNPAEPRDTHGRRTDGGTQVAEADTGTRTDATEDRRQARQIDLRGIGPTFLDTEFADRLDAFDRLVLQAGIVVRYTSRYRNPSEQAALGSDPHAVTPANLSLHSAGLAVDIDWGELNPNQRIAVLDTARRAGLSWGGDFGHPDPVHFYYDPGGDRRRLIDEFGAAVQRSKARK